MIFYLRTDRERALFEKTFGVSSRVIFTYTFILTFLPIWASRILGITGKQGIISFLLWLIFIFPSLEFCFALYSWLSCHHSMWSIVKIKDEEAKVLLKTFRFTALKMMNSGKWKLVRHCPALSYKRGDVVYLHVTPRKLSRIMAVLAIVEELFLLTVPFVDWLILHVFGKYWMPLLLLISFYSLYAIRTTIILSQLGTNKKCYLSGDPQMYDGIGIDYYTVALAGSSNGVKFAKIYWLPELLWLKNPQNIEVLPLGNTSKADP